MRPASLEITLIDRELDRLRGLKALPGWRRQVDILLTRRLRWMEVRDRGFLVTDRRRIS